MMKYALVLACLLTISAAFAATRLSTSRQQQKASSIRSQFIGTWKLVYSQEKLKDGSVRAAKDFGPHAAGYLMYSEDGHMCAELMNPDRPKWNDPPTPAQKIAAVDGFAAYCGPFEIDEVNHIMWHHPEVAWSPDFVGTKQKRPYRFEGNRLTFSDKAGPDDDPDVAEWTIVWEKVK